MVASFGAPCGRVLVTVVHVGADAGDGHLGAVAVGEVAAVDGELAVDPYAQDTVGLLRDR